MLYIVFRILYVLLHILIIPAEEIQVTEGKNGETNIHEDGTRWNGLYHVPVHVVVVGGGGVGFSIVVVVSSYSKVNLFCPRKKTA